MEHLPDHAVAFLEALGSEPPLTPFEQADAPRRIREAVDELQKAAQRLRDLLDRPFVPYLHYVAHLPEGTAVRFDGRRDVAWFEAPARRRPYLGVQEAIGPLQSDLQQVQEALSKGRVVFRLRKKREVAKAPAWLAREVLRVLLFADVPITPSLLGPAVACVTAVLSDRLRGARSTGDPRLLARDLVRQWVRDSGYQSGKVRP